jgi:hypothetical protein
MSQAIMQGLDIDIRGSLRSGSPHSRLQSSVVKKMAHSSSIPQDGIMLRRVYQGSTDSDMFENFIAQLLHHCGRYLEPKSVIVMDNV